MQLTIEPSQIWLIAKNKLTKMSNAFIFKLWVHLYEDDAKTNKQT